MSVKKGNWLCNGQAIGKAVNDEYDRVVDICLYDRDGSKIGRESEPFDGPKGFEPCCDAATWRKIERPDFPLKKFYNLDEQVQFI